jgi:hypothetical protein
MLYFNTNYYVSCPQFNEQILYMNGVPERGSAKSRSTITHYNCVDREIINTISIGAESTISHMFYDNKSGLLFAAAGVENNERTEDTILVIDPVSKKVHKIWLGDDESEGKEGAIGSLVVHSLDREKGIIYAASVYSDGGNPALYIIRYQISGDKITSVVDQWTVGEYGPLALCMDIDNGNIYALSHGYDAREGSVPSISVIDSSKGELVEDTITLPAENMSITPYKGNLLAIDYGNHNLVAIVEGRLFYIDPKTKEVKIFKNHDYQYVASSYNTKNIYVVTEEKDFRSSKPFFNCLLAIRHDFSTREIIKLSPEVEVRDITCSENRVCLDARYRERDEEHSLWLFDEIRQ